MHCTKEDCIKMQQIFKGYLQMYFSNQPKIVLPESDSFMDATEAENIKKRLMSAQNARQEILKKKMHEIYAFFFNYIASDPVITKKDIQVLANVVSKPCYNSEDHPFTIIDAEYQILFGAVQSISRYLLNFFGKELILPERLCQKKLVVQNQT